MIPASQPLVRSKVNIASVTSLDSCGQNANYVALSRQLGVNIPEMVAISQSLSILNTDIDHLGTLENYHDQERRVDYNDYPVGSDEAASGDEDCDETLQTVTGVQIAPITELSTHVKGLRRKGSLLLKRKTSFLTAQDLIDKLRKKR